MYFHPCNSTHSGLYGLGIVYVYRVLRADNMFDTKPVRQPDNRPMQGKVMNELPPDPKYIVVVRK